MFRSSLRFRFALVTLAAGALVACGPLDEEEKEPEGPQRAIASAAGAGPTVPSIVLHDAGNSSIIGTDLATIDEGRTIYFATNVSETAGENDGVQSAIWSLGGTASIPSPHTTCDDAGAVQCAPEPGGFEEAIAVNTSLFEYQDDLTFTVVLTACDEVAPISCTTRNFDVTVVNVAPQGVTIAANATATEGETVTFTANFSDPGALDTHTCDWDWGDGTSDVGIACSPGSTRTHTYADEGTGTYTVSLTITDDEGATGSDTHDIAVSNVAPTVAAGADQTVSEGQLVSLDPATFNDLGTADTHTATIDWGDGTVQGAALAESPFGPPGSSAGADGTVLRTFGPKVDFAAGDSPRWVAVGDFNNDGIPDLSVVNGGVGNSFVSILLGTGGGTFAPKVDLATPNVPTEVATGLFNLDANLDFVTVNQAAGSVSVFLGSGDGTTFARTDYGTGGGFPASVAVGDVNGDGSLDLAVANAALGSSSVGILLGNGAGGFGAATTFATGNQANSVAISDLNADGRPDLAIANTSSNSISILLGNGDGTFGPRTDYPAGSSPSKLVIANLNSDLSPDVAVTNYGSDTVSVFLGNGDGTFKTKTDFVTGIDPHALAAVDVDQDGVADLAVPNDGSNTISILLGTGLGNFAAKTDFAAGTRPQAVAAADLNADGRADLITPNNSDDTLSVLLASGNRHVYADNGTFTVTVTVTDNDGGVTSDSFLVTIGNVAPSVSWDPAMTGWNVDEGTSLDFDFTFTDPGGAGDEAYTVEIDFDYDGITFGADYSDTAVAHPSGNITVPHTFADNDSANGDDAFTVAVRVADKDGGQSNIAVVSGSVNNVDPVIDDISASAYLVNENEAFTIGVTFSDEGNLDANWSIDIDWDGLCVAPGDFDESDSVSTEGTTTYGHTYADGPAAYDICVQVTDKDGGTDVRFISAFVAEVDVSNVAPAVSDNGPFSGDEGVSISISALFSDSAHGVAQGYLSDLDGPFEITWDCDGGGPIAAQALYTTSLEGTIATSCTYPDDAVYTGTVDVQDKDGDLTQDTFSVTISNVAPDVGNNYADASGDEGEEFTITADFADSGIGGSEVYSCTVDWDDGTTSSSANCISLQDSPGPATSFTHAWGDQGVYTVTVTVCDDDGACDSDTAVYTISNVAPAVFATLNPYPDVAEGSTFVVDVDGDGTLSPFANWETFFSDAGSHDTHTVTFTWADGTSSAGIVFESPTTAGTDPGDPAGVSGGLDGSHVFADDSADARSCAGPVCTVVVEVCDDENACGTASFDVLVTNATPVVSAPALDASGDEGSLFTTTSVFTDAGIGDDFTVAVDFGDGTVENESSADTNPNVDLLYTPAGPPGSTTPQSITVVARHRYRDDAADVCGVGAYAASSTTFAPRTLVSPTALGLGDDSSGVVTPPFPINFAGNTFASLNAISNGNVQFTSNATEYENDPLPVATTSNGGQTVQEMIAIYWDDLRADTGDDVYWEVQGVAPNRELVIEWRMLPHYPSSPSPITVQMVLFENSSNIEMHYIDVDSGDGSSNGAGATIGVQVDPGQATQFSFNTAGAVTSGTALSWQPQPATTCLVTVSLSDDDGASVSDQAILTVDNVAPVADAGADLVVDEGVDVCLANADFTDAGVDDTHTGTIDWADPNDAFGVLGGVPAGAIYNPANGHYYVLTAFDSWFNAEAAAVALGGHLVTINDAAENGFVDANFASAIGDNVWLGLNDAGAEALGDALAFVWSSNEPSTYRNFGSGEPNQAGDEDGVVMYPFASGAWNDADATGVFFGAPGVVEGSWVVVVDDVGEVPPSGTGTVDVCHTYTDSGVYTATLTVSDDDGGSDPDTVQVTVNNVPPTMRFRSAPISVIEGSTITYTASVADVAADSVDAPFTIEWDFECVDTNLNSVCDPSEFTADVAYTESVGAEGPVTDTQWIFTQDNDTPASPAFIVAVRASDADESANFGPITQVLVNVADVDPVFTVALSNDTGAVDEDSSVTFSATIDDGAADESSDEITFCRWNFGDGGTLVVPYGDPGCSGNTATATYDYDDDTAGPGSSPDWNVTLTLWDEELGVGSSTSSSTTAPVNNVNPNSFILSTSDPDVEGEFSAISINWEDPAAGRISDDTYTVIINWGDLPTPTVDTYAIPVGQTVHAASHLYANPSPPGGYSVSVTVLDDDSGLDCDYVGGPNDPGCAAQTTTSQINVANTPLELVSVTTNAPVDENSAATVWAIAAGYADADNLRYSFDWDGDGTYDTIDIQLAYDSYTRSDDSEDLGAPAAGAVRVTVQVEDISSGETATGFVDVVWSNVPPVIDSAVPTGAQEDNPASLQLTISDVSPDDEVAGYDVEIDWNADGDFNDADEAPAIVPENSPVSRSHTYADPGNYVVTIRVHDESGEFSETQATLVISDEVEDPVAVADSYTVDEDETLAVSAPGLFGNDSDPDTASSSWSVNVVSGPSNGDLVILGDGSFVYEPTADFNGTDSFDYEITDGTGGTSNTVTVTITVNAVNDAPVANADGLVATEDQPLDVPALALLANDSDVDGDALEVSGVGSAVNGTVAVGPYTAGVTIANPAPAAGDRLGGATALPVTLPDVANGAFAVAGQNMLVGASFDDPAGLAEAGSAYVLDASGAVLVTLNKTAPVAGDRFGSAVAVIEDAPYFVVGAPQDDTGAANAGAVYVFDFAGALVTTILNPAPAGGDRFGSSLAVVDGVIAIGAPGDDTGATNAGIVYLYQPYGTPVATIANPAPAADDFFGYSLAADDGLLAVGAPLDDATSTNGGTVYVFDASGAAQSTVNNPDPGPASDDRFGFAVAMYGSVLVAGAPQDDTGATNAGSAYLFDAVSGTYQATLVNPAPASGDQFGTNVALSGTSAFVGAPLDDATGTNSGTVYVFDRPSAALRQTVDNPSPAAGDNYGNLLGSHGSTLVTGAPGDDTGAADAGALYAHDGSVVFTPAANFSGVASFSYTLSDGSASSTATVTINVTPVNDPPVAGADEISTDEDVAVSIPDSVLLGNDSDIDSTTLTVTAVANPVNGTVALAGGVVTFTPAANVNGQGSFEYTLSDGALSVTSVVIVTIHPVNDVPVANDGAIGPIAEDTNGSIDLATLVTDVEAGALSFDVTQGANGSVSLAGSSATYVPAPGYNGSDSFTYTVADAQGGNATGTISVTITSVNDPPVANDDFVTTAEDTAVTILPLTNDDDQDGPGPYVLSVVSGPANGTAVFEADGTIVYTPNTNFNGTDSFDYQVDDSGAGGTDTATVTVTVNSVNDLPVASGQDVSVDEDDSVLVTLAGSDVEDGATLASYDIASNPANGTLTATANPDVWTYTPNAGFHGSDAFTFTVTDADGGTSSAATVAITVVSVNDPVVAVDDAAITNEDTAITLSAGDLTGNDTDADTGAVLSVTGVANALNGSVSLSGGAATFTPDANFNGTGSFEYTVSDGAGSTDTGLVTITVVSVNDLPVASAQSVTVLEDDSLLITLVGSDVEDGATLASYDVVAAPVNGTLTAGANPDEYTYTPSSNFAGSDSFTFTVTDSDGGVSPPAMVSVTVTPVNDPPIAGDDFVTTAEDTAVTILPLTNDDDVDGPGPYVVSVVSGPSNGTAVFEADGTIVYTPDANFNGTDTFQYEVDDSGAGGTDTATVTVTVNSVNDVPVASGQDVTVAEDDSVLVTLVGSDVEDGATLASYDIASNPTNGTLTATASPNEWTYTPNANFHGSDSFTFTVTDADGGTSSAATVAITVTPVNDPVVAVDDSASTNEDVSITLSVADLVGNDTDPDGDTLFITGVAGAGNGSAVLLGGGSAVVFTPNANFNGAGSFQYTVSDGAGSTDDGLVIINVIPVNDIPVANAQNVTLAEDAAPVTITLTGSDVETNPLTVFTITSGPVHGTLTATATPGEYTYDSDANYHGDDAFTFTVTDANGGTSSEATVSIEVTPVNDGPVAVDDTVVTDEDQAVTVQVLVNDTDLDGDTLTVTAVSNVVGGTAVVQNGTTVEFTPTANLNGAGAGSFDYTLSDGTATDTGSVVVNINSVNDLPVATSFDVTTPEDTAVATTLAGTDVEAGALTYVILTQPNHGSLSGTAPNLTYTPAANYFGDDVFTYVVRDAQNGQSDPATVSISVTPVGPSISSFGDVSGDEGQTLTFTVNADESGYVYQFDWESDGTYDTTVVASGASASAGHAYPDDGTWTVTVRVTDGAGLQTTDTATATIANVAPVLVAIPDRTVYEQHLYQMLPSATDAGSADTHTWSMTITPMPAVSPEFSSTTGLMGWVPLWQDSSRFGTAYDVTVRVTDDDGDFAEDTFTLTAMWRDDDGDGMSDTWEIGQGMDPTVDDSLGDIDGDGISNFDEFNNAWGGPYTPDSFSQVSPLTGDEDSTEDLQLVVNETNDQDTPVPADITYTFEVYDGDFDGPTGAAIGSFTTPGVAGVGNTLTLTVDDTSITDAANPNDLALVDDAYYWWRARATDDAGHGGAWTALQRVFYNPTNDAPTAPLLTSPLDTASVSSLTPVLVTDNSSDADDFLPWGDLTLRFEVFTATGTLVTSTDLTPQGAFGNTSWVVNQALTDNTWYSWRVTAIDPNDHPDGSQSTASALRSFFVNTSNDEPTRPTLVTPLEESEVSTLVVDLVVGNATDPEAQPLTYLFEVAGSPTFSTPDYQAGTVAEGGNGQTSFTTAALQENTWYWWRCRASDGYTTGEFVMGSFFVSATNDPPTAPIALTPSYGMLVDRNDVVLAVQNASDPENDVLVYRFTIYKDAELTDVFEETEVGAEVAEGVGTTTWTPSKNHKAGDSYYWTAVAIDEDGAVGPASVAQKYETLSVGGGSGCSVTGVDAGRSKGLGVALLGLAGMLGLIVVRRKKA